MKRRGKDKMNEVAIISNVWVLNRWFTFIALCNDTDGSILDPWKWLEEKSLSSGMAHYWSLVTNLQIGILVFARSVREGNFYLYVQSLRNLLKWFFALDHTN